MTFYDAQLYGVAEQRSYPTAIMLYWPERRFFKLQVRAFGFTEGRKEVYPEIYINITYKDGHSMQTLWEGRDEPIYIYEYEAPQPLEPLEPLSMIVIGVAIGVAISTGSVLLGIKIGEKRAEKKKANP
jgi:hypothetical protein